MAIRINLPTLHAAQADIFRRRTRLNVGRCGRRFGKDVLMVTIAADAAAKGKRAGLFAPEHKQLLEPYDALTEILAPIRSRSSRTEGTIRTASGGVVDLWQLNDNELAGRGREYDVVIINEGAFTKVGMLDIWKKSIKPTLLVRRGTAWVLSTPKGIDEENFFYQCCHDPALGFKEFYAPTSANPLVPPDELEKERRTNDPNVFRQEFLAEWISWSGIAFFSLDKLLHNGFAVNYPKHCDAVFAVVDTATKTGKSNDSTGVVYVAVNKAHPTAPLVVLDWEALQLEGASLEVWLPTVLANLEMLAKQCGARAGSLGAFIEDKDSGQILLQQAARKGMLATAIPATLTALGKDERALSVSGFVYQGKVKLSGVAYDKVTTLKGTTRNHLVAQVTSFRLGDKDSAKRADDLLDVFVYAISLSLGNPDGF